MAIERITSFTVDHTLLYPGIYVSRIDGDITTYDLRMRKPNTGDLVDNASLHSLEHMLATFMRNSELKEDVIYVGPMGCQTGFYLLMRNADNRKVLEVLMDALRKTAEYTGPYSAQARRNAAITAIWMPHLQRRKHAGIWRS